MLCFSSRAAFKCWCQALDDIFRKQDVLHTWKEFGSSLTNATNSYLPPGSKDYSEEFLSNVGIWGCLQGAVISAKIAQWVSQWGDLPLVGCLPVHVEHHASDAWDTWTAMSIPYKVLHFPYLWCVLSMAISSSYNPLPHSVGITWTQIFACSPGSPECLAWSCHLVTTCGTNDWASDQLVWDQD